MQIVRVVVRRQGEPEQHWVEFNGPLAEQDARVFVNIRRRVQVHWPWTISATLENGAEFETSFTLGERKLDLREQLRIGCQMERMYGDSWDIQLARAFMESLDE